MLRLKSIWHIPGHLIDQLDVHLAPVKYKIFVHLGYIGKILKIVLKDNLNSQGITCFIILKAKKEKFNLSNDE